MHLPPIRAPSSCADELSRVGRVKAQRCPTRFWSSFGIRPGSPDVGMPDGGRRAQACLTYRATVNLRHSAALALGVYPAAAAPPPAARRLFQDHTKIARDNADIGMLRPISLFKDPQRSLGVAQRATQVAGVPSVVIHLDSVPEHRVRESLLRALPTGLLHRRSRVAVVARRLSRWTLRGEPAPLQGQSKRLPAPREPVVRLRAPRPAGDLALTWPASRSGACSSLVAPKTSRGRLMR
jgi:hypothetical protein